ncbi:MAG: response regulator transcription factor [Chloroflexota bacterium]|nr:response regulator transcription factor [Chloroflexota bacterium]
MSVAAKPAAMSGAGEDGTALTIQPPLRILIVDDDPAMVGAITALVGTEGHQVITAYDGLAALKRSREEQPDLVMLDLVMSEPDGLTVVGLLRAASGAPIMVVSGEREEATKVRALGLGADDYLTKPFGKAELLARIAALMRRVARGDDAVESAARGRLRAGALVLEPGRHSARVRSAPLALTPTEFRLLEALVRASGDVVSHAHLARAGWPTETEPDLLWLKPHLVRLRAKVERAGGPSIVTLRGVGHRIEADAGGADPEARPEGVMRAALIPGT